VSFSAEMAKYGSTFVVGRKGQHGRKLKEAEWEKGHVVLRVK
jgi:hypothetical protein